MRTTLSFQPKFTTPITGKAGFEFGKFVATARALFERLQASREEAEAGIALEVEAMIQKIIERTPVDESPERDNIVAKDLWQTEITQEEDTITWRIWNEATNPNNDFAYPGNGTTSPHTLEFGWSGQAPLGMVRISIEEFRLALSQEINLIKSGG